MGAENIETRENIETKKVKLDFIDSLRGIAAWGVIIVHTGFIFKNISPSITQIINNGARGVQLFFVISAFTIFLSLDSRKETSPKPFLIRRFFRIAPLFYTTILCCAFFVIGIKNINFFNLLSKIAFIDNFYPDWVNNGIIGVEWTIGVEAIFYILAPFLFTKIKNMRSTIFLYILVFILPILMFFTGWYPISPEWNLYRSFFIISHLHIFVFGILIYFLYKKYINLPEKIMVRISNICVIILGILLILDFVDFEKKFQILNAVFSFKLQFVFYIFLLFFASIKSSIRKMWVNNVTMYLGKISFSSYLLHLFIFGFIYNFFEHTNTILATITAYLGIIAISSITYYMIEKPFINIGNKIAKKYVI